MKWYKHISDSLDDPFIFDLMTKFGAEGYLLFFGILEIYAREFKPNPEWKLEISIPQVCSKLLHSEWQVSHKLVPSFLQVLHKSGKWDVTIIEHRIKKDGTQIPYKVLIHIKKFTEMLDEWTARKLGSYSGVTRCEHNTDIDIDKELDIDITNKGVKKKKTKEDTPEFLSFWNAYPKKSGSQKAAFDAWKKLGSDLPSIDIILSSIMIQKGWRKNANGEFRPEWKDPERWLKNKMWESDFEAEVKKAIGVPKDDFRKCKKCGARTFKGDLNEVGFCIKCEGI